MTQAFDLDEARKQLADLGSRIEQGRSGLSRPGGPVDGLDHDWQEMRRRHQEISEKLATGMVHGSAAAETLRTDIDELRHGFARWAARVERRFHQPGPGTPGRKPLGWD
jgi:hypothetical protein